MKIEDIIGFVLANPDSAFFYSSSYRKRGTSYLFRRPEKIITVTDPDTFEDALDRADALISEGKKYCGYISYEAGYLLENRLRKLFNSDGEELARFYFFGDRDYSVFEESEIDFSGSYKLKPFSADNFHLNTSKENYIRNVEKIKKYIEEGDTYQVNYTVKGLFDFSGDPGSLFLSLLFNQSAEYAALINTGSGLIISVSPELFFRTEKGKITAEPMKGTGERGINTGDDISHALSLVDSMKDRAENLMIVDLLRNDLGKIAKYGTVSVEELFKTEKYESLFQMTSVIRAELEDKITLGRILRNLFPCGSITGAPKIRTMEIINELEDESRGIYTGAIGIADKNMSVFNVAIRTIKLNVISGRGELGLGGGIVWDSDPQKEYEEALLKGRFLTESGKSFKIFETARIENGKVLFWEKHARRLKEASDYFLFKLDEKKLNESLFEKISELSGPGKKRLKIELDKYGGIEIFVSGFPEPEHKARVKLSGTRTYSGDRFLQFKTTSRKLYDREYAKAAEDGFFDVIFMNELGDITEGAISNLFIVKDGSIYTPHVSSGLLPGIYRKYFIDNNPGAIEKRITLEDIFNADELLLTNSLRGVTRVTSLTAEGLSDKLFESP